MKRAPRQNSNRRRGSVTAATIASMAAGAASFPPLVDAAAAGSGPNPLLAAAVVIGLTLLVLCTWLGVDTPEMVADDGFGGIVFDSMAEGLLIADPQERLVLMNRRAEVIFGAEMREVPLSEWATRLGIRLHDGETACPPADFPLLRALRGEAVSEVELLLSCHRHAEGAWITGGAQPLGDDDRHPRGAVMVFRDVTARRRAQAALTEERQHRQLLHTRQSAIAEIEIPIPQATALQALLDRAGDVTQQLLRTRSAHVAIYDVEVQALLVGAAGETTLAPRSTFEPPEQAVAWITEHAQAFTVPDAADDPFAPGRLKAQGVRAYAGVPVIDDGLVVGILFVVDDRVRHFHQEDLDFIVAIADRAATCITKVRLYERLRALNTSLERRTAELHENQAELARHRAYLESLVEERTTELDATHRQLRQADRLASIGTLTAGLGHDMNNVLFPVRCRLDALRWETVPAVLMDTLQSVAHAVTYLQQLTDGLRLFALDPEDAQASASLTDPREWWDQVSPLLEKALPKNVTLESHLEATLPQVRVAPHRLTQALLNLVVNAGEAMPNGGRVRIEAHASDDDRIRIVVRDEGLGMTPQVRLQAFDPFFTTKTRGLSTGLGLSLVHGVVTSSRGTIDVDSTPGIGTTVTLSFPAGERSRRRAPDEQTRRRAIVQLADARLAAWIGGLLQTVGYAVEMAGDVTGEHDTLWVTDAAPDRVTRAIGFLSERPDRSVIAIGARTAAWTDTGAIIVEDAGELDTIRTAINRADQRTGEAWSRAET